MKLDGRVAVVTGAGSGMGRAMIEEFHAEGATVVAVDIRQDAAQATIDDLGGNSRGLALAADVSDEADAERVVGEVVSQFGRLDVLCNNAGVLDDYTTALDTTTELWNRVIGVNLGGAFFFSRAALPQMISQGKGAIINTASISAFVAGGGGAAYTASKHGVLGLTKQLAFDYGKHGIRANAICPGAIHTGMTGHLLTPEGANPHVDAAVAATPAGRWGTPQEIAHMALFLASDDAAFIHGAAFTVDGGWVLP
ncbi:SDR family NAD(P)-dependent oxidoreductase [Rhodococcus globerulus]|uniref:Glucose 1-dehydrogenase n=1 Tax=Rhodococcus globerulus TaxID=33008 RepID=A0ABU4C298_RHOGO|nr:glucose 1-dehydrogenase [Rhodococcus globerulus]MDV6270620.1 glucose 1-dehydrogenase [Rhodococcus globerulus]